MRVAVDPDQAAYLHHLIGEDSKQYDQTSVVTFQVRNREGFRSFILTFLEHAEVLDPPEARADIVSWLEALT